MRLRRLALRLPVAAGFVDGVFESGFGLDDDFFDAGFFGVSAISATYPKFENG
jgi:hypothetical protein